MNMTENDKKLNTTLENFFSTFRNQNKEIPKGNKLETITLSIERKNHYIQIEIDVVAGTDKAKHKKIVKAARQIQLITEKCSTERLMHVKNIKVVEKDESHSN